MATMSVPTLICAVWLCTAAGVSAASPPQETRPANDKTWKGGVTVPAGAVAVADDVAVLVDVFVDEMARRYNRQDLPSAKVLETLISESLVRSAAEKSGIEVTDADVQNRYDDLAAQLRKDDPTKDLTAVIKAQGVEPEAFRKKLRSVCFLDRLARIDQRIPDSEPVTPKHHHAWLLNRRKEAKVEIDPTKLPPGVAATVDGVKITQREFVRDFLPTADEAEIRRVTDMLARSALMDAQLQRLGFPLEDADLDAELAARKADFESKPQYQGIAFADIVKQTTAMTADEWKRTRGFRLEAGYTKLGRRGALNDDVQAYYEKNLPLFGPRYAVKHLLIRGSNDAAPKGAKGPPPLPMAKARLQAETLLGELRAGKRFEDLVQLYSEDTSTKLSGGVIEPFTVGEKRLHPSFSAAVERLEVGQVSGLVETPAGVHLIKLERKDPPPPVEQVEPVIRRELGLSRFRALWDAARYGVNIRID